MLNVRLALLRWWAWLYPLLALVIILGNWTNLWQDIVWDMRLIQAWKAEYSQFKLIGKALFFEFLALEASLIAFWASSLKPWQRLILSISLFLTGLYLSDFLANVLADVFHPYLSLGLKVFSYLSFLIAGYFLRSYQPRWLMKLFGLAFLGFVLYDLSAVKTWLSTFPQLDWLGISNLRLISLELIRPSVLLMLLGVLLLGTLIALLEDFSQQSKSFARQLLLLFSLSLVLSLSYSLSLATLNFIFHQSSFSWQSAMIAGFITTLLMGPAQDFLRRGLNQLFYGMGDEPQKLLLSLSKQSADILAPEALLEKWLLTLKSSLKLAYVGFEPEVEGLRLEPFPLNLQGEHLGNLNVARTLPLTNPERQLLSHLAQQFAVLLKTIHLQQELKHSLKRLALASEEERKRLSRDLHDGLAPLLAGLNLSLEAVRMWLKHAPDKAEQQLLSLKGEIQEMIDMTRQLIYNLRPPKLDSLGLLAALDELLIQAQKSGLNISKSYPERLPPLNAALEMALYRIAQEGLANVVRHARATHLTLTLTLHPHTLSLSIEDNGIGLKSDQLSGIGLQSMRERTESLLGSFRISSQAQGGSRLEAHFPL
ncbi:MAG: sensor histidine kinase [Deinococcales bacterium]